MYIVSFFCRKLFISIAGKCYELIIILETVREYLFNEIIKSYNTVS